MEIEGKVFSLHHFFIHAHGWDIRKELIPIFKQGQAKWLTFEKWLILGIKPFWSWGKSAFRDYLWDNKLDSWDFIFIGSFENSDLGIEIKIKSIFLTFCGGMIELRAICTATRLMPMYKLVWLWYVHHYADKTNRVRNEKSWELSERSKTINRPFFVNGRFLVKWPCFKIRPFS